MNVLGYCVTWYKKNLKKLSIGWLDQNIILRAICISHYVYGWHWSYGRQILDITHKDICFWLLRYTNGFSCP